jgi:NUMOD4 motif
MSPIESFKVIPEFPEYMVSNYGRVFNIKKGLPMTLSPTEAGDLTVGLMNQGVQHRRSVKLLVARAFVPGEDHVFDTPIQLDRDKENLAADNLAWRPRWFAWRYATQFNDPPSWAYTGPIQDTGGEVEFDSIIDGAFEAGLLMLDIRLSLLHHKRAFPTGWVFRYKY